MQHVLVAEPSWRGHTLVFATRLANLINELGVRVTLGIPEENSLSIQHVRSAREALDADVEVRSCFKAVEPGYLGTLMPTDPEVVETIIREQDRSGADRVLLPTADSLTTMRQTTPTLRELGRREPRSIVHQPKIGYGGYGHRQVIARELIRWRLKRCGHRLGMLDPLSHRSAVRSGIDAELVQFPIQTTKSMDQVQARELLGIPKDARVISALGEHSVRKGTLELIRAWPETTPPGTILLVMGLLSDPIREELDRRSEQVQRGAIIFRDELVPNQVFQAGFIASDVVTALYPKHHGISGIVQEAANYEIPVLGSEYGAMGLTIEEDGLGETLDARDPAAMQAGLQRIIQRDPVVDTAQRMRHLENQSPEKLRNQLHQWLS